MTKAQKIIVLVAAVSVIAAIMFPPAFDVRIGDDGLIKESNTRWVFLSKALPDSHSEESLEMSYPGKLRKDVLFIEIFGVLVLAGAACLITKKR